jgi:hypothetical protein
MKMLHFALVVQLFCAIFLLSFAANLPLPVPLPAKANAAHMPVPVPAKANDWHGKLFFITFVFCIFSPGF